MLENTINHDCVTFKIEEAHRWILLYHCKQLFTYVTSRRDEMTSIGLGHTLREHLKMMSQKEGGRGKVFCDNRA